MDEHSIISSRLRNGERNFHGVSLVGFDFSGMNLRHIDFGGSDLRSANFNRCSLHNANFSRAHLENSTFFGAKLINANLSEADLSQANMGYADLRGATLARARVRDLNMTKADLRGADLRVHDGEYSLIGPWRTMTLYGAIFNSSTKSQERLSKHGATRDLLLPLMVIKQGLSSELPRSSSEQIIYKKATDIWITGSFYLLASIMIVASFALISRLIPWHTLISIFIIGILLLVVIGAFILRHLNHLDQKNFVELVIEVFKKLPLLGSAKRDLES